LSLDDAREKLKAMNWLEPREGQGAEGSALGLPRVQPAPEAAIGDAGPERRLEVAPQEHRRGPCPCLPRPAAHTSRMNWGGALLLLCAVALASCGGQVARGSGDSGADAALCEQDPEMSECCGFGPPSGGYSCEQGFGASICGPNGWICPNGGSPASGCSKLCIETTDAGLGDDEGESGTGTSTSDQDAGNSCVHAFFADPEAGADAGPYTLTPEDVACTTTADCVVTGCGNCCPGGGYVFGVNESSAFMCFPGGCPPPSDECSPGLWSQDCRSATALADVEVACINGECRTFATSSDASSPDDANGEEE